MPVARDGVADSLLPENEEDLTPVPMADAEVFYASQFALPKSDHWYLDHFIKTIEWRQETIKLFGKEHLQPRLIAWHGDRGAAYRYSGLLLEPEPWTQELHAIKDILEQRTGAIFNSVLLNYYRDHRDSMGMHSDDEPELGALPVIASLSFGEERTLVFKRKSPPYDTVKLNLESGSLLLMKGETQSNWKHGINKRVRPCGPRINLTFRRIINTP